MESSRPPAPIGALETPAALVDLAVAGRNARAVARYLGDHAIAWRPHVKTHKSRTLARLQLEAGAKGLTVATLHEAEAMAPLGVDLLLAHPPVGQAKERRLAAFLERSALTVALDSDPSLRTVARAARAAEREVGVLVEIDAGMGRMGIEEPGAVVELASLIADVAGVRFDGILFYPGHIRLPADAQDAVLAETAGRIDAVLEALGGAGLAPGIVSGGSTPTLWRSHEFPGVTEIRAGTCIFHDRDTLALGVAEPEDVAYRIVTTVIGTAVPGRAVVDAGSKALAKEEFRGGSGGYGTVVGHPDVVVRSLSEEHGVLDLGESDWSPDVGERVLIVPNHVCVSVNLQERLFAYEEEALREIPLEGRGRLSAGWAGPAVATARGGPGGVS